MRTIIIVIIPIKLYQFNTKKRYSQNLLDNIFLVDIPSYQLKNDY